jgi:hypothetical protein
MSSIAEKYLTHIEQLIENPEVSEFAIEVYNRTCLLIDGKITREEFNDGNYLVVFNSEFEHTKLAKTSINHIKEMIANDVGQ